VYSAPHKWLKHRSDKTLKRAEEKRLIQRAQAGDEEAFAQLYRAHVQAIYRYVYQRVSDVHLAEDITGDVFIKALEGLPHYQDRGQTWLAWLYRIAHARVVDFYRKRDRRPRDSDLDYADNIDMAENSDMDAGLVEKTMQETLQIALEALTDEQRQVIHLRFMEGKRIDAVAQIMDKKPNAIKALQHRALRTMASRLERAGLDAETILAGLS
jgi:RNA polymerase sigma-70 factor (ECF subfamily)